MFDLQVTYFYSEAWWDMDAQSSLKAKSVSIYYQFYSINQDLAPFWQLWSIYANRHFAGDGLDKSMVSNNHEVVVSFDFTETNNRKAFTFPNSVLCRHTVAIAIMRFGCWHTNMGNYVFCSAGGAWPPMARDYQTWPTSLRDHCLCPGLDRTDPTA